MGQSDCRKRVAHQVAHVTEVGLVVKFPVTTLADDRRAQIIHATVERLDTFYVGSHGAVLASAGSLGGAVGVALATRVTLTLQE
jgi:hypothetical protein